MIKIIIALFSFVILLLQNSYSQDIQFSQFYANPLYLNPALAGFSNNPRFILNFRDQWTTIPHAYVSYAISYDQYFKNIRGGIGVQIMSDKAGSGLINTNILAISYAYQYRINKKIALKTGFQVNVAQKRLNWNQLIFNDMLDPIRGYLNQDVSMEINPGSSTIYNFDVAIGGLIYTSNLYGGIVLKHLAQPGNSFYSDKTLKLPVTAILQLGNNIKIYPKYDKSPFIVSHIMYIQQAKFKQLNLTSYLNSEFLPGGLSFKHTLNNMDAVAILIGFSKKIFKFRYSYDFTFPVFQSSTGGAHEVSIEINLGNSKKKIKQRQVTCPDFF